MKYFLLFLSFILLSCSQSIKHKYGRDYNSERIERGIPIIEDYWFMYSESKIEQPVWGDGKLLDESRSYHLRKFINLKGEDIQSECDQFYKKINDISSSWLTINYYYFFKSKPWDCKLVNYVRSQETPNSITPITIIQADSVLASWGLSRTGK